MESETYKGMKTEKKLINMAEDKFAEELMNDEELDNVAGGCFLQTAQDGKQLFIRGLISANDMTFSSIVTDKLHELSYGGYETILVGKNTYKDKNGNNISRDQFWKNFDAENGTSIIKK